MAGADFDKSGVRIAMCHTQNTAMYSYLREDLTALALRAAHTTKQFTDRLPCCQSLNKTVNEEEVALEKESSNSGEKGQSTSVKQPLNKPMAKGDTAVDKQTCNYGKKVPSTSSKQPLNKLESKGDAAVRKEPCKSGKKAPRISREQSLNKPLNKGDVAVNNQQSNFDEKAPRTSRNFLNKDDKQPRNSGLKALSLCNENSEGSEPDHSKWPSTSSQRKPLSNDKKKTHK